MLLSASLVASEITPWRKDRIDICRKRLLQYGYAPPIGGVVSEEPFWSCSFLAVMALDNQLGWVIIHITS
jgi:hypothetical protein